MSTETVDPRYIEIDRWPTLFAVEAMVEGQMAAVASIRSQAAELARASDAAAARLLGGGRLVYVGAGTSGRIAVQDGVELTPTYNWPEERLVFLLAGGMSALSRTAEGAEDNAADGAAQIAAHNVDDRDVVIGVAASGRTPFTVSAVQAAGQRGALTIAVANNPGTPLLAAADHRLLANTGSELVAGSTRMKAGTAQKALLNILSTTVMLRCGLVYRGRMVNMRVSNDKLARRAKEIVQDLAGVGEAEAERLLADADGDVKMAVLLANGVEREQAGELLLESQGNLRTALESHAHKTV